MLYTMLTATGTNPFQTVSEPIIGLLNMALTPALGIVGALGAIYCIILGAKLAKAEEPQDREKAKKLYDERKEKYLSAADFVINGDMGARKTAMQIADIFR